MALGAGEAYMIGTNLAGELRIRAYQALPGIYSWASRTTRISDWTSAPKRIRRWLDAKGW